MSRTRKAVVAHEDAKRGEKAAYRAVAQLIKNEMGVNRGQIEQLVKETVMTYMKSQSFEELLFRVVPGMQREIISRVAGVVQHEVERRLVVSVGLKDRKATT